MTVARLAEQTRRRADLVGLRFAGPADRARLVEIVRGPAAGDAALARALDLAGRLGTTPIVVHDGPGADPAELGERLLFAAAIEAVRCLEEGVVVSVAEANVGSLLGAGFPDGTGGALPFATGHPGGLAAVAARAAELSAVHGERFAPPPLLAAKVARGESFADDVADG